METINSIYAKHYSEVLTYVTLKLKGKHEIAEELTNDVFLKVNEHLCNYDSNKSALKTWIFNIANNKIIDYFRRENKNPENCVSDFVNDENKDVFSFVETRGSNALVENQELKQALKRSFNGLKPEYHKIAALFFLKERSYNEIAEICEIPMGSVKAMIFRCRKILQKELQNEYANIVL